MLDFLVPAVKYARYVFALGILIAVFAGVYANAFIGIGTAVSSVMVLLGVVLGVLLLKTRNPNAILLAMFILISFSLVFPVEPGPVPSVEALSMGAVDIGTGDVVPLIKARVSIALLATFLTPAAGLLSMKVIYSGLRE